MCGREYLDGANLIIDKNAKDLKNVEIGSQVGFGTFYYDYYKEIEPIDWIVLDKNENGILLISKYLIDCQRYKSRKADLCWKSSNIRKYLNDTFLQFAFTDEEKSRVIPVALDGLDSEDYVFLLDNAEYSKYKEHITKETPTPFTVERAIQLKSDYNMMRDHMYIYSWLRNTHGDTVAATSVRAGIIGMYPNTPGVGVRPALWVKFE